METFDEDEQISLNSQDSPTSANDDDDAQHYSKRSDTALEKLLQDVDSQKHQLRLKHPSIAQKVPRKGLTKRARTLSISDDDDDEDSPHATPSPKKRRQPK